MNSIDKSTVKKKKRQSNFLYDFVRVTGFVPVYIWMRPKTIYATKRPKIKGGFLIAANHIGFTDPVLVHFAFWRRRLNCIATKDLFQGKTKNAFFNKMNCIMVDKENFNMRTFHTVCERLQEEKAVVVFPEGAVNHNPNEMMSFKSGAILMAYKAKKPIVPMYIAPPKKWWNRRVCVVGEPLEINPDGKLLPSMDEVKQINAKLQEKEFELKSLYEEKYAKKCKKEKRNECVC